MYGLRDNITEVVNMNCYELQVVDDQRRVHGHALEEGMIEGYNVNCDDLQAADDTKMCIWIERWGDRGS